MKKIIKYAHGKINFSLDILSKREDGYHEIESIMQEILLKDKLSFENREKNLIIESNSTHIPLDTHNLVHKVWEKMNLYTGEPRGAYVYIEKNIPVSAGLAGGSSNAAASFKALNELWDLNLSQEKLMDLGKDIGADVPFCILGGTALARGIGEELTPLKAFSDVDILVCNPGFEISTEYAYRQLDLNTRRIDTEKILKKRSARPGQRNGKQDGKSYSEKISYYRQDKKRDVRKWGLGKSYEWEWAYSIWNI